MGLVLGAQACHTAPPPSVPDLSGTYIAHSAEIQADPKTVDEILATFQRAEEAIQRRDVEALVVLYDEGYKHRGFIRDSLRTEWKHLFEEYHDFSITHLFTRIQVKMDQTPPVGQVTCTGSLWAVSNQTGQRVNIDSWFGEVHYLIYKNGGWRIHGHAWEVLADKGTRFARSPHPFF